MPNPKRMEELLRSCLGDYGHPSFTDRHGMADRIRACLEEARRTALLDSGRSDPPRNVHLATAEETAWFRGMS